MKYQRLVSNTTPASLQDWLEEELESRGIDGVYTRYILSLLQQDYLDLEPSECQHTPLSGQQKKISQQYGAKEYMLSYSKSRHQKWKSWEKERLLVSSTSCCNCGLALDLEERKKSAAVECLKSASEQKIGIEKLIDEVCIKLKNVKTTTAEECKEIADEGTEIEFEELPPSSPQDQAEKYYAAFPALNGKTEPLTELCHQQSRDDALEGVWNARLLRENALPKPTEMHNDSSSTNSEHEDSFDSAAEKENAEITSSDISKHDLKQSFKICSTEKNANDLDKSPKPSFIVPKMKTSMPRKPFSVRYLPFNQLLKHTHDTMSAKGLAESEGTPDLVITDLNTINISAKETEFNKVDNKNSNVENIKSNIYLPVSDTNLYETEKFNLEENNTKEQLFGNLFENFCDNCEKLGLLMCAAFSDVSQSHVCKDKNDSFLVEQLLSKFNSRLASIWRTNGQDKKQKEVDATDSHWQLFKLSSVETNDLEHNDGSVWAFNKEDLEKINEHKWPISSSVLNCGEATEILSAEALPELLRHIKASKHLFENASQEVFCSTSLQSVTDTEEQENAQNTSNTKSTLNFALDQNVSDSEDISVDSDIEGVLTAYSESFFPTLDVHENTDHLSNVSSDRESTTPDSLAGTVQGIYSLWKSSSDSTLMLGKDLKKIWDPSPMDESSNWLALPIHDDSQKDWGKANAENFDVSSCSDIMQLHWNLEDFHNVQRGDSSLSKVKCTLTYHKGESKFVEVIPSNKRKFSIAESDSCRSDSQEMYQCDSVLSNTDYLSDDDDDDEENLLTSPKTHFQPIRQDSVDTENSDDVEVMMLTVKDTESPPILKESATEINITESSQVPVSETENYPEKLDSSNKMKALKCKTGSPIQKLSTSKVIISPTKERKRGRAISSSFEELISLTGQFPYDGTEVEFSTVEISSNLDLISFHLWKTDQFKDKGTNTDTPSSPSLNNHLESHTLLPTTDSLSVLSSETYDESQCSPEAKVWNLKDYRKTPGRKRNLPGWKWSISESDTVEDNIWYHSTTSDWNNVRDIKEIYEVPRLFENNTDVNALRKEIKEEEDQLFRDISHLNNTCDDDVFVMSGDIDYDILVCNSNKDCSRKCNKLVHFTEKGECGDIITEEQDLLRKDFLGWNDETESFTDIYREFYDRSFSLSDLDLEDGGQPTFPSVPADKILYSSDLEDEWRKNSQPFGVQVPRRRLKYKSPPQKRPCSFYLEGNCRRSDCRFSHDLSTITCRFWEEGSCFKGITCPFLHGYIGDLDCHEINGTSDCNYTLESEADFPSLSAVKNKESETKSNPQDITSDKGNRPKRKKGKSQSGWSSQKIVQPVVSSSWPGCSSALESPDDSQE